MLYKRMGLVLALGFSLLLLFLTFYYGSLHMLIGGDKDDHGCLVGAGYGWDDNEKECVRSWISEGEERYQVNDFESCAEMGYPVAESYPRQCTTMGGRHFVEDVGKYILNGVEVSSREFFDFKSSLTISREYSDITFDDGTLQVYPAKDLNGKDYLYSEGMVGGEAIYEIKES